jgi:hypothetical protein
VVFGKERGPELGQVDKAGPNLRAEVRLPSSFLQLRLFYAAIHFGAQSYKCVTRRIPSMRRGLTMSARCVTSTRLHNFENKGGVFATFESIVHL